MRKNNVLNELRRLYQSDDNQWSDITAIDSNIDNILSFEFGDKSKASSFYDFIEFHIGTNQELKDCLPRIESIGNTCRVILEVGVVKEGVYA